MNRTTIGIHGIGVYLPEEVRTNDWWSPATVARWRERGTRFLQHEFTKDVHLQGTRIAIEAMMALVNDPFKGAKERRIAPNNMLASEMEVRAARDAVKRAAVRLEDIEVCLVYSVTPDFINTNACKVHYELGLPERCFTMSVDCGCNSFQMQLALAERMLASRPGKYALLVQSCTISRLLSPDEPASAWFGDGATAVVVGSVSEDFGVLSTAHFTDGSKSDGLVFGVEGKRWYEEGRVEMYVHNRKSAQRMIMNVVDHAKQAISSVLQDIRAAPTDVRFYAAHQGTVWLRQATQTHAALTDARSIDTFSRFGSLVSSNLPLILALGEQDGMLRRGDLTVLFSGGLGETWSATALRWGVV